MADLQTFEDLEALYKRNEAHIQGVEAQRAFWAGKVAEAEDRMRQLLVDRKVALNGMLLVLQRIVALHGPLALRHTVEVKAKTPVSHPDRVPVRAELAPLEAHVLVTLRFLGGAAATAATREGTVPPEQVRLVQEDALVRRVVHVFPEWRGREADVRATLAELTHTGEVLRYKEGFAINIDL